MENQTSVQKESTPVRGVVQLCCQARHHYVSPGLEWHNESMAEVRGTGPDDPSTGEGIIGRHDADDIPDAGVELRREDELPATGAAYVLGDPLLLAPCIGGPQGCEWRT